MIPLGLRVSMRLLTIAPLPWRNEERDYPAARAIAWFIPVGLLIGAFVYAVLLTPIAAIPRAALALTLWIAISRGLHEDALMDCADASLAMATTEKRNQIRKDPHVGAHGVTGSGLLLMLRFAALTAVSPIAGLLAPLAGRWCMALSLQLHPSGGSGLGAHFSKSANAAISNALGIAITIALALALGSVRAPIAIAAALLLGIGAARWLTRRLGSASGDVHGAAGVIAETALLYAFVIAQ